MSTPEYRACIDYACRKLHGSKEVYITFDSNTVFDGYDSDPLEFEKDIAVIVLAELTLAIFEGVEPCNSHKHFFMGARRKSLAYKVNEHLKRVSDDFDWLRQRIAFYTADTCTPPHQFKSKDAG